MPYCAKCGNAIGDNHQFCGGCGALRRLTHKRIAWSSRRIVATIFVLGSVSALALAAYLAVQYDNRTALILNQSPKQTAPDSTPVKPEGAVALRSASPMHDAPSCTVDAAKQALARLAPNPAEGCQVAPPICQSFPDGSPKRMIAHYFCGNGGFLGWNVFDETAEGNWTLSWTPSEDLTGFPGGGLTPSTENRDELLLTEPIYRKDNDGLLIDPMCCAKGGTKDYVLRWKGNGFVVISTNDSQPLAASTDRKYTQELEEHTSDDVAPVDSAECDWRAQMVHRYAYQRDHGEPEDAVLARFDASLAGRPAETIEINRRLYHPLIDFAYRNKNLTPIETMVAYGRACRGLPPLAPTQWFFLLPPMKGQQAIDLDAPLTKWDVEVVVPGFQSEQACITFRESRVSVLTDASALPAKRELASVCRELNENSLFSSPCPEGGVCIHSNDSSLTGSSNRKASH